MIHGEGFDPKDLAIDFDEDTSKVTIDGVKGAENEPEGDPALQGMEYNYFLRRGLRPLCDHERYEKFL